MPTIAKTAITIARPAQCGERLPWQACEGNGTVVLQIPLSWYTLLVPGPANPPNVEGILAQWRDYLSVERGGASNGSMP